MDSVRAKHAAELEAKRKKLEEIRRRKASIRTQDESFASTETSDSSSAGLNDFIENILRTTTANEDAKGDVHMTDVSDTGAASASATQPLGVSLVEKLSMLSTVTNVAEIHIQPTLVETYTKHTETTITLEHEIIVRESSAMTDGDGDVRSPTKRKETTATDVSASPSANRRKLTVDTEMLPPSEEVTVPMSEEEKQAIMRSDGMEAFLIKASRVIERALASTKKFDIMVDYGAMVEEDSHADDTTEALKAQFAFKDDKWTKHRAVTDIDVSPFYPELMLVSYTARDFLDEEDKDYGASKQWDTLVDGADVTDLSAITEGVVLLWSSALPTRPEYRFTCHSQITSACFNPFDRHLILGGTYSGQIVIWDTRAKSAPVQKTSMSSCSHTHPIYSMAIVGTKSSYHLISASTDGRVCVWDIDQLQQPIDVLDLRIACSIVSNYTSVSISTDKKMEASVTSFSVFRKENKELYIGTEAGKVYSTKLDQQKSKTGAGTSQDSAANDAAEKQGKSSSFLSSSGNGAREVVVNIVSKEASHFGPVTAMHFNPLVPVHRDGLLLTCSLDSTVKLWSTEHAAAPVFSFEPSNEYVCDVRWSSVHPALFAVVDGSGVVSLWNICRDVEVPVVEAKVGDRAINKVRWSADGRNLLLGDADGNSYVYEVPADIALPQPDDLLLLESKVANAVAAAALTKA
ncbi:TPA: hypothetical protein N0F65_000640 [Lagenidium giganteum]|uniref:Dynein intermediate chain n=1 Tax=Lagenidium giganteum TaxID=4803 RepID=A0AAV2YN69_9STRA|nr:TPA: hypothetical protein N0F65_000640 [Lagenidium giganteum]